MKAYRVERYGAQRYCRRRTTSAGVATMAVRVGRGNWSFGCWLKTALHRCDERRCRAGSVGPLRGATQRPAQAEGFHMLQGAVPGTGRPTRQPRWVRLPPLRPSASSWPDLSTITAQSGGTRLAKSQRQRQYASGTLDQPASGGGGLPRANSLTDIGRMSDE